MVQEDRGHEAEDYGLPEWERHVEPVVGLGVQFDAPQTSWRNRMECVRYPGWEWSRLRSHANGHAVSQPKWIMASSADRGRWLKRMVYSSRQRPRSGQAPLKSTPSKGRGGMRWTQEKES